MDNANGTQIGVKFKNSVTGQKKLEEYSKQLTTIQSMLAGMDKQSIMAISNSLKNVSSETKNVTKQTKKATNLLNFGFKAGSIAALGKALNSLSKTMTKLVGLSSSYIENVNLLEVAYANINRETGTFNESIESSSKRIETYIDKMAEAYGLDESRLTRSFGIFKQLANAMELPAETGERLSEIMVKMTNDVASLYNLPLERASNALQSALVGQVRPIRGATGADITEKTLQKTVDNLGLERSISDLSFVEKRLIMVISLTNQLKVSQGDYARTIESTANQIKIMQEQWERLSRAVGNVFYSIFEKILPYINGVLMALTEIFSMLASLLGFKMPEFDYSTLAGVSEVALDLEEEMVGAGEATDELASKLKGLRSFDKLNVINTPSASKSGGGAGGGVAGSVDPTIMDAFNKAFDEYDDKLDSVRMKASKIKDDIMHWLGFEKEINEETGKIEWKYQGIGKTLKNMWESFKKLNPLAKLLVGYLVTMAGVKVVNGISNIVKAISGTQLMGSLKNIVEYTQIYSKLSGSKTQGLLSGVDAWERNATSAEKLRMRLAGTTGVIVGIGLTSDAMRRLNDEGLNLNNSLELLGGTMSGVLGGAMIGASLGGGWGAVIGAIGGGIIELGTALLSYENDLDKIKKRAAENLAEVEATAKETSERIKNTNMEIASQMYETNYHEQLLDELQQIMDANGQIKQGYEDRANFILNELGSAYGVEYEIIDGVLQKSDEVTQSIKDQIRLKEQEIILEAYKKDYIWALGREGELIHDLNEAQTERYKTEQSLDALMYKSGLTWAEYIQLLEKEKKGIELTTEEKKKYNKANEMIATQNPIGDRLRAEIQAWNDNMSAVQMATQNYVDNQDLITRYSAYSAAVQTGDLATIDAARDEWTKTYVKDEQIMTKTSQEESLKRVMDYYTELDAWKKNNKEKYNDFKSSLTDMNNYVDGVTPEMAEKWAALGYTSSEEFMNEIKELPEGLQREIIGKMYETGVHFDYELQRGLDSIALSKTVKIEGDASPLRNIFNNLGNAFSNIPILGNFSKVFYEKAWQFADGGFLPPVGNMFVMNERGPELLGQIGGKSFVANQNQMMDLLDRKIGNAQNNQNKPMVFNIYLDESNKLATYTLDQLENRAKTNGQPITIGG